MIDDYPDITLDTVEQARNLENPLHWWDDDEAEIFGVGTEAGVSVTEHQTWGYSPAYRGISIISHAIGKLPCITYRNLGDDKGKARDRNHPAYRVLRRRANRLTPINHLFARVTADAILHGNGYARIELDGRAAVKALERLDPRQVDPPRSSAGETYTYNRDHGGPLPIFWDQILHVRFNSSDGLNGLGLLSVAKESLGLGIGARTFGARYFRNASTPATAVMLPHAATDKQITKLRAEFENVHKGLSNAHRVAFVTGGGELKPISVSPAEAMLIDLRGFEVREIANFLNLPPDMLGDDAKTSFASLEMTMQSFLDNSLDPWLAIWEFELNEKLLTGVQKSAESHRIEFLRQALVRADMKTRAEYYNTMLMTGVFTRNEVRLLENKNALDGLDEPLAPMNMGPGDEDADDQAAADEPADDDDQAARTLAQDALVRFAKRASVLVGKNNTARCFELAEEMVQPAYAILGRRFDAYAIVDHCRENETPARIMEALT